MEVVVLELFLSTVAEALARPLVSPPASPTFANRPLELVSAAEPVIVRSISWVTVVGRSKM